MHRELRVQTLNEHTQAFAVYFEEKGLTTPLESPPRPETVAAHRAIREIQRTWKVPYLDSHYGVDNMGVFYLKSIGQSLEPLPTDPVPPEEHVSVVLFEAPPGQGKTTLMDLFEKIFKRYGVLKGHQSLPLSRLTFESSLQETGQRMYLHRSANPDLARNYSLVVGHFEEEIASAIQKERGVVLVENGATTEVEERFELSSRILNRKGRFGNLKYILNKVCPVGGPSITYQMPIFRELMRTTFREGDPKAGLLVAKAYGKVPINRESLSDEEWYRWSVDGAPLSVTLAALDEEDEALVDFYIHGNHRLNFPPFNHRGECQFESEQQFKDEVLYPDPIKITSTDTFMEARRKAYQTRQLRMRRPIAIGQRSEAKAKEEGWPSTAIIIPLIDKTDRGLGIIPELVEEARLTHPQLEVAFRTWDRRWKRTVA